MSEQILFVDDEPLILQGIQRSLRHVRQEWSMKFATSGREALEILAHDHFDVVITDMRMPGMDGAQLLELVKTRFPTTVRMILSGQSDQDSILRSIGLTHQYLSKPCDAEEMQHKLARTFALRDLLPRSALKKVVCGLSSVPSQPSVYEAVIKALQSPETTAGDVGALMSRDVGMAVKLLQLANPAFFRLSTSVSNVKQAAAIIGIDTLRILVSSGRVFSRADDQVSERLIPVWEHSQSTAALAKAIARSQGADQTVVDSSFAAGLLHDVGQLLLICSCREEYERVLKLVKDAGCGLLSAEEQVLGCTHASVGAYLLGLWGLPEPLITAVAYHHRPSQIDLQSFSAVVAVHAADYLDGQSHSYPQMPEKPALDRGVLARLGLENQLTEWEKGCAQSGAKGASHG